MSKDKAQSYLPAIRSNINTTVCKYKVHKKRIKNRLVTIVTMSGSICIMDKSIGQKK